MAEVQPAAPAAAPEAGALDFLKSTPMGLALMQGGLSMLGGTKPGEAFGQGFQLYQGLMAQEKGSERYKAEQALKERQVATQEGELQRKKEEDLLDAKVKREAIAAKAKAAKVPKGVDPKLWEQARKTEEAAMPLNEDTGLPMPIDRGSLYRRYNSMAPEGQKVSMPFGASEMSALINAAEKNPEFADLLFSEAGTIYDPMKIDRVRKRWDAKKVKAEESAPSVEATPPAEATVAPVAPVVSPAPALTATAPQSVYGAVPQDLGQSLFRSGFGAGQY